MSAALEALHADIGEHCDAIKAMFKPGAKITVIVRNPSFDDADVVVSDDTMAAAIKSLRTLAKKDKRK